VSTKFTSPEEIGLHVEIYRMAHIKCTKSDMHRIDAGLRGERPT